MSERRCLVQLSDPHIVPRGATVMGRVDTAAGLRDAVARVQRLALAPCAVLLSGDLTNDASAASHAHLRELLAPLPCPVYLMPGNHDDRDALRAGFPDHHYLGTAATLDYAVELDGMRLVALDSVVPGDDAGALGESQLHWLDATLAAAPERPTLVAVHHPPFDTGLAGMDALRLQHGSDRLATVLHRHRQVRRLLCGHVHRPVQRLWGGTLAMTAPSTAHQIDLDLRAGEPPRWTLEPPGFLVHLWDGGGEVVSHVVHSTVAPGPFDFV